MRCNNWAAGSYKLFRNRRHIRTKISTYNNAAINRPIVSKEVGMYIKFVDLPLFSQLDLKILLAVSSRAWYKKYT